MRIRDTLSSKATRRFDGLSALFLSRSHFGADAHLKFNVDNFIYCSIKCRAEEKRRAHTHTLQATKKITHVKNGESLSRSAAIAACLKM